MPIQTWNKSDDAGQKEPLLVRGTQLQKQLAKQIEELKLEIDEKLLSELSRSQRTKFAALRGELFTARPRNSSDEN